MSRTVKPAAVTSQSLQGLFSPLPWQTSPQARRWFLDFLVITLLLTSFIGGYHTGSHSGLNRYHEIFSTGNYYLPVDSRQLTVAIVPLQPGPQTLQLLGERASGPAIAARQLVSETGLEDLAADLQVFLPLGCRIAEPLVIPDECFSTERRQYRADLVLNWLAKSADRSDFRTIGVLGTDIYKPDFNFLFGLAKTGGGACIASSARMGMSMDAARLSSSQRWHSIVRHELGHTLGLLHNESERSVMVYGNSLGELDQQPLELTAAEWRKLEEIHPIIWHY